MSKEMGDEVHAANGKSWREVAFEQLERLCDAETEIEQLRHEVERRILLLKESTMFELETMLKGLPSDSDADLVLTAESAREIAAKFGMIRTALRRIVSLDEKNVPKYAQQIAQDALRHTH